MFDFLKCNYAVKTHMPLIESELCLKRFFFVFAQRWRIVSTVSLRLRKCDRKNRFCFPSSNVAVVRFGTNLGTNCTCWGTRGPCRNRGSPVPASERHAVWGKANIGTVDDVRVDVGRRRAPPPCPASGARHACWVAGALMGRAEMTFVSLWMTWLTSGVKQLTTWL